MQVAGRQVTTYSVALLGIVLLGVFLRVYNVGTQNIWYDEAFSVWISKMSLPQIVQTAAGADNHPPLYYFMLHYWMALFGTSEAAVRLLSVLFGVLAIPIIYLLGRQLFKEEVGLLAALILALSVFNIQQSQDARMYSLMVLLALVSMYFFTRFLQRNPFAISVGYLLSTTLLLYTHLYGAFVVIAQNIYLLTLLLLSREHAFRLRHWITLQVLLVVFFVPWISAVISQLLRVQKGLGALAIETPQITDLARTLAAYVGSTFETYSIAMLLLLFLALCVLSLFTYRKVRGSMDWKAPMKALKSYAWEVSFTKDYNALYFLAVWLLTINVIPFVISRFFTPIYFFRYTIAASVALYLIVAKGITHINYRYAKLGVVIVVVALSAANLQTYYTTPTSPQAQEAAGFIKENAKNGDLVILTPDSDEAVSIYYGLGAGVNVTTFPGPGRVSNITDLQSDVNGHNRVWLVAETYDFHLPNFGPQVLNKTIQTFNNASYNTTYHKSYDGYEVYLFEKRA